MRDSEGVTKPVSPKGKNGKDRNTAVLPAAIEGPTETSDISGHEESGKCAGWKSGGGY